MKQPVKYLTNVGRIVHIYLSLLLCAWMLHIFMIFNRNITKIEISTATARKIFTPIFVVARYKETLSSILKTHIHKNEILRNFDDKIYAGQSIYIYEDRVEIIYKDYVRIVTQNNSIKKEFQNRYIYHKTNIDKNIENTIRKSGVFVDKVSINLSPKKNSRINLIIKQNMHNNKAFQSKVIFIEVENEKFYSADGENFVGHKDSMYIFPAESRKLNRGFGYMTHPVYQTKKMHTGIDIDGKHGGKVFSAADGKVIFVGYKGGYGNCVIVKHEHIDTLYGHLSKFQVKKGDIVKKGQQIAKIGSTGCATGPHLHFEIIKNGKKVNPMSVINKFKELPKNIEKECQDVLSNV